MIMAENNQRIGEDIYIRVVFDITKYDIGDIENLDGWLVYATEDKSLPLDYFINPTFYMVVSEGGNNYISFDIGFNLNRFFAFKIIKPSEDFSREIIFDTYQDITPRNLNKEFDNIKKMMLEIQTTITDQSLRIDSETDKTMLPKLENNFSWVGDTINGYRAVELADKYIADDVLDMNGFRIINLRGGIGLFDAVNRGQVFLDFYSRQIIDDTIYKKANFISEGGVNSANKPIKTNGEGVIDSSLLNFKVLQFQGNFTPTLALEYPTDDLIGKGNYYWTVQGVAPTGYTFTTGDLIGETAKNRDAMAIGQDEKWHLIALEINPDDFLATDGSNSMNADLNLGTHKLANVLEGINPTDGVNLGQITAFKGNLPNMDLNIPYTGNELFDLPNGIYDVIDDGTTWFGLVRLGMLNTDIYENGVLEVINKPLTHILKYTPHGNGSDNDVKRKTSELRMQNPSDTIEWIYFIDEKKVNAGLDTKVTISMQGRVKQFSQLGITDADFSGLDITGALTFLASKIELGQEVELYLDSSVAPNFIGIFPECEGRDTTLIRTFPTHFRFDYASLVGKGGRREFTDWDTTLVDSGFKEDSNVGDSYTKTESDNLFGGGLPIGSIIMYSGDGTNLDTSWALCDGNNGTPDLTNKFVRGATAIDGSGATGGSDNAVIVSHGHTFTGDVLPDHSHNITTMRDYSCGGYVADSCAAEEATRSTHGASAGTPTGSISSEGVDGTNMNLPSYYTLAYIMKIA